MMARALAAKVGRIERKISIRWMWEVALFAWSAEQRTLLFAVMAQRPDWIASWPEARHAWPCRALERDPHIFPDRVLMAIVAAGSRSPLALPAPPLLLPSP